VFVLAKFDANPGGPMRGGVSVIDRKIWDCVSDPGRGDYMDRYFIQRNVSLSYFIILVPGTTVEDQTCYRSNYHTPLNGRN
jgi:hypothetical protein